MPTPLENLNDLMTAAIGILNARANDIVTRGEWGALRTAVEACGGADELEDPTLDLGSAQRMAMDAAASVLPLPDGRWLIRFAAAGVASIETTPLSKLDLEAVLEMQTALP